MAVITISIPDDVLAKAEKGATAAGLNRSQFIVDAVSLRLKVAAMQDAETLFKQVVDQIFIRAVRCASEKHQQGLEPTPEALWEASGMSRVHADDVGPKDAGDLIVPGSTRVIVSRRRPFKRSTNTNT